MSNKNNTGQNNQQVKMGKRNIILLSRANFIEGNANKGGLTIGFTIPYLQGLREHPIYFYK